MSPRDGDIPLSIAFLFLIAVIGGYFYFNYLRYSPEFLRQLTICLSGNQSFWWVTLTAATLNMAVIGSFIKRTIGLQRQGSRLKHLEGLGFSFRPAGTDLVAVVFAGSGFLILGKWINSNILIQFVNFFGKYFSAISIGLPLNLSIFIFLYSAILLRRVSGISFSKDAKLSLPPYRSNTLVLGTMEVMS